MAGRYGLEIRGATASDAQGLSELLGAHGSPASPRQMADRLDRVRPDAGAVLIAVEWGPPSGVIALSWWAGLQADAPVCQVTTLLVHEDARRRGRARLLLKAAARTARTAGCDVLQLSSAAGAVHDFCRATGFVEVGGVFARGLRTRS